MNFRLASTALLWWAVAAVAAAQPRAVDLRVRLEGRDAAPNLARMIEVELVQLGFEVRRDARSVIRLRGEADPVRVESPAGEFVVDEPYAPARAIAVAELLRAALLRDEPAGEVAGPQPAPPEEEPSRNDVDAIDPDEQMTPDSELFVAPPNEEPAPETEAPRESTVAGESAAALEAPDLGTAAEEPRGETPAAEERSSWDLALGVDAGILSQEGPALGGSWGARASATFARWFRLALGVEGLFVPVEGSYTQDGSTLGYALAPLRLAAELGAHWRHGRWRVGGGLSLAAERVVLEGLSQGDFVGASTTEWIPSLGVPLRASVELIGPLALTLRVEPIARLQTLAAAGEPSADPSVAVASQPLLGSFALRAALGLEVRWPR